MADLMIAQGVKDMMFMVLIWAQYFIGAALIYYFVKLATVKKDSEPDGVHAASPGVVKHVASGITDLATTLFGEGAKDLLQYKVWGKNARDHIQEIDSELAVLAARHKTLDDKRKSAVLGALKTSVDKLLSLKSTEMKKITEPAIRTHIQNQLTKIANIETNIGSSPKQTTTLNGLFDAFSKAKPTGKTAAATKIDKLLTDMIKESREILTLENAIEAALKATP